MMRLALVLVVGASAMTGSAGANPVMSHREHSAMIGCRHAHVRSCILRAALHRGVSYGTMIFVANRETGGTFNPRSKNPHSTARGLFQFLDTTWAGRWNPYRFHTIFSAKYNSLAAALGMSEGNWSWWAL